MKPLFVVTFCVIVLTGCKGDDSVIDSFPTTNFTLVSYNVSPFAGTEPQFYEPNQVIWRIDFQAARINVSSAPDVDSPRLGDGEHNYELKDDLCNYGINRLMEVNDRRMGVLIMDDFGEGRITITDTCIDGGVLVFQKIN